MTHIEPSYRALLGDETDFAAWYETPGELAKQIQNRNTRRFSRGERFFYIKCHAGVGWREIIKNLSRCCLPVIDAFNEWRAIKRLEELQIQTMTPVGYGISERNPASRRSFLITEDLGPNISLEQLTETWVQTPPEPAIKRDLIARVARIAQRLHGNGVNHRDFYLCHFLLGQSAAELPIEQQPLYLIDLHRAQLRRRTPRRWIVKDLGGLYFSAMAIGLTRRDLLRFVKCYGGKSWRDDARFWADVEQRAKEMHRRLG